MPSYKIEHKKDECISCGACVAVCEENWVMRDDGSIELVSDIISEEQLSINQEAAECCPVECIIITEIQK